MRPYAGFLAWEVSLCKRGRLGESLLRYEAEEFVDLDELVVSVELSFFEEEEEEELEFLDLLFVSLLFVSPLFASPFLASSDFDGFSPFFP